MPYVYVDIIFGNVEWSNVGVSWLHLNGHAERQHASGLVWRYVSKLETAIIQYPSDVSLFEQGMIFNK